MIHRVPFRLLVGLILGSAVLPVAEVSAGAPPMAPMRNIISAVQMNVRQAFKPTFAIRSRYASGMTAVAFHGNGKWFANATASGTIHVWDLETGQKVLDLGGHEGPVADLTFLPPKEGQRAFSRVKGDKADKGDKGGKAAKTPAAPAQPAAIVTAPPGEIFLASAGSDGKVILWDAGSGQKVRQYGGHDGGATHVTTTPAGVLVSGGKDGTVKLWNAQGEAPTAVLEGGGAVQALAVSPDGTRVASSHDDGKVRVREATSGAMAAELSPPGSVTALAWDGQGVRLAGGGPDGVFLWQGEGQQAPTRLEGAPEQIRTLAFSSDGGTLYAGGGGQEVISWTIGAANGQRAFSRVKPAAAAEAAAPEPPPAEPVASESAPTGTVQASGKLEGHQKGVNDLSLLADGRVLASASDDQTVRFWNPGTGKEVARMVTLRSGWAVVTPEGFFDGTLDGDLEDRLDAIRWDVESQSFSLDGFLENYYRPALLGKTLQGQPPALGSLPHISDGFHLPPKVEVKLANAAGDNNMAEVEVTVEDQGGGIEEVRLFQNGKAINPTRSRSVDTRKGDRGEIRTLRYTVQLVNGTNAFSGVGLSKDRIEGEMAKMLHSHDTAGSAAPPALHVFVVGINKYKNAGLDLNFGVPDARSLLGFFSGGKSKAFERTLTDEIYDNRATRPEIVHRLKVFEETPAQDTVIIYLAGHGETVDETWHFITHEVESQEMIKTHALSANALRDLIMGIGARNVLLLMDSCKSGSAVSAIARFDKNRSLAVLSRSTGVHIATATTEAQLANELSTLGHGLFTHALLTGMKGEADRAPADSQISVKEIMDYVKEYVPLMTEKYRTASQVPLVNMRGDDFVLVTR